MNGGEANEVGKKEEEEEEDLMDGAKVGTHIYRGGAHTALEEGVLHWRVGVGGRFFALPTMMRMQIYAWNGCIWESEHVITGHGVKTQEMGRRNGISSHHSVSPAEFHFRSSIFFFCGKGE